MNQFPSSQSVPSANPERLFFALWIIFSVLTALADIIAIVRHPEMTLQILPQTALGLAVCLPFGAVSILLRRRRLKRQAARDAFLQAMSRLD